MSLINNMLKDLEDRKTKIDNIPSITLFRDKSSKQKKFRQYISLWPISLLALLIICCAVLVLTQWPTKHNHDSVAIKKNDKSKGEIILSDSKIEDGWQKIASITGITVDVKDNITEVAIMLSNHVLYRVAENSNKQLIVTFDHADLQTELPNFSYLNSGIEGFKVNNLNQQTQFVFSIKEHADVQALTMNENDKPELLIKIKYDPPKDNNNNVSEKMIKTPVMQTVLIQQYQSALALINSGQNELAMTRLNEILNYDPHYNEARVSLAALLFTQEKHEKGNEVIDAGIKLDPFYSPFVELKARYLVHKGQIKQALDILLTVSPPVEENPDYHALMAALYERTNKDLFAIRIYQALLDVYPHNGNWWFGLGASYEKLGQNRDAINAFSRALAEGNLPTDASIYLRDRLQNLRESKNENE